MKELTIEQKAQRYDEALGRAKEIHAEERAQPFDVMLKVFPELKESEDERIRKSLIGHLKECRNNTRSEVMIGEYAKWIAWLEKQGEQKPADKVEPKFREGDCVVYCNDDVDLITGIEENGYSINNGGYIPFICENEMRLWNITDAKVGDVLVSESNFGLGTWYCIFKSLDDDKSMTVYCYLARDGRFETKKELCFDKDPYNTKPATKEQRDQLEKAMANAGYTFDFDKKELKKIEGTTAWSEENEKMFEHIIAKATLHFSSINYLDEEEINFLKSLRPQTTWKPSDEQIEVLESIRKILHADKDIYSKANNLMYNFEELIRTLKKLREE